MASNYPGPNENQENQSKEESLIDDSEPMEKRLQDIPEEFDALENDLHMCAAIQYKNNHNRRKNYYHRLFISYLSFDKLIKREDFNKLIGTRFIEGLNFPIIATWVKNPDIIYNDDIKTFSFHEYGSVVVRNTTKTIQYPSTSKLCHPTPEVFDTEIVNTDLLTQQTQEIERLKQQKLFNASTFSYLCKPIKAVEIINQEKQIEIYIQVEWPGFQYNPKWVPISDFTEPSILVKEGLLDVQGKVIYKETEKKEKSSKEMTQIVESRKRASDVQEVTRNKRPSLMDINVNNEKLPPQAPPIQAYPPIAHFSPSLLVGSASLTLSHTMHESPASVTKSPEKYRDNRDQSGDKSIQDNLSVTKSRQSEGSNDRAMIAIESLATKRPKTKTEKNEKKGIVRN